MFVQQWTVLAVSWLFVGVASAHTGMSPNGPDGPSESGAARASGTLSSFSWVDYDGDGLLDAWALSATGAPRLLRNSADGTFEDRSASSGLSAFAGAGAHQLAWGDFDADGRLDLFLVAYEGESQLLRQNEAGVFEEITEAAGVARDVGALHAHWLDYDQDGRLDLHLVGAFDEQLYHGVGNGSFERLELGVSSQAAGGDWPSLEDALRGRGFHLSSTPGPPDVTATRLGGNVARAGIPVCPLQLQDSLDSQTCIGASETPVLGELFPLSTELFVSTAGDVGMGTLSPAENLHVVGRIRTDQGLVFPDLSIQTTATLGFFLALLVIGYLLAINTFEALVVLVSLSGSGALQLAPSVINVCFPSKRLLTRVGVLAGIGVGLACLFWTLVVDPHPLGIHGAVWSLALNWIVAFVVSRFTKPPSAETVWRIHGEMERFVYGDRGS